MQLALSSPKPSSTSSLHPFLESHWGVRRVSTDLTKDAGVGDRDHTGFCLVEESGFSLRHSEAMDVFTRNLFLF